MLLVGSNDGVYRLEDVFGGTESPVGKVLDSGSVMRLRRFRDVDGVFAATRSGLYHSPTGDTWQALGVPTDHVYSVGAAPERDRLYAGTRPARVFEADLRSGGGLSGAGGGDGPDDSGPGTLEWRELEGFQDLPSRDDWRLPRHENVAQVRDVHVHPATPDRLVAGVEVGGVHVSEDGGETWTERRGEGEDTLHDDVHELVLVGPDEFVAATGYGLFRSTDAGRSWTRLDEGFEQRYFRSALAHDDAVFAGAALAHTATWVEDDADPALFVFRPGEGLRQVEHPRPDETVTGLTAVDDGLVAGTHVGTLLAAPDGEEWAVAGSFPVPGKEPVSYTPLVAAPSSGDEGNASGP